MDWEKFETDLNKSARGKVSLTTIVIWTIILIGVVYFALMKGAESKKIENDSKEVVINKK